ncbi:MAG: chemotaxis protein CheA [Sulfitobacter sp.]
MSTATDPMAEIKASFFVECDELLEVLQDGLQSMEDDTSDAETIHTVFRAVHSIKGGAGAFGLDRLVRFSHRFETVLEDVRKGILNIGPQELKVLFQTADHLSDLVSAARDGKDHPIAQTNALLSALEVFLQDSEDDQADDPDLDFQPTALSFDISEDFGSDGPPLPPIKSGIYPDDPDKQTTSCFFYITFKPSFELFETGNEPALLLGCLQELGRTHIHCDVGDLPELEHLAPESPYLSWEITLETDVDEAEIASIFEFVVGLCQLEISLQAPSQLSTSPATLKGETQPDRPEPAAEKTKDKAPPQRSVVRVDLERIERLVNLVGELVINQAMLSQSLEKSALSPHSDTKAGLEEFQRLTRDIQDSVMMIRAQPVKSLFQRMSRIVREASSAVGKDVRLLTEGDAAEVDKTVIERLADPLTHLIRNAVDHGIESPQARIEAGKPSQGVVRLSAAHRSGRVIIEVSDDGAGIDREKVLQIAQDKGLVARDAQFSIGDIDNLLFLPGFSTVSKVSDLSGRGVGMDVVRTEIQALGGRVTISSDPGTGTCFSISLPLTLAVLDGMVIDVAAQTLVLPLTLVIETMTLAQGDVQMMRPGSPVVQVRGAFVPVIDLGRELGYRAGLIDFDGAVALLISHENGSRAALIIDNIVDQRQVVIKGLNDSLYRAPGVAAATILGDGQIALILDPSDIISQALAPMAPGNALRSEGLHA